MQFKDNQKQLMVLQHVFNSLLQLQEADDYNTGCSVYGWKYYHMIAILSVTEEDVSVQNRLTD